MLTYHYGVTVMLLGLLVAFGAAIVYAAVILGNNKKG